MDYREKLRDPKWQKKRLEVLEAAGFECEHCGDKDTTLHVHHKIYRPGHDPWDCEDGDLVCLCEKCHKSKTEMKRSVEEFMADPNFDGVTILSSFVSGIYSIDCPGEPNIAWKQVEFSYWACGFLGVGRKREEFLRRHWGKIITALENFRNRSEKEIELLESLK